MHRSDAKPKPFDWKRCAEAFTAKDSTRLAQYRHYSVELVQWLRDKKLIGIHEEQYALPVHDERGYIVGAHVRAKDSDKEWFYFPKGTKVRPFVIGESQSGDTVHLFESPWDGFPFMDVSGERHGIIITRGASNGRLAASVIPERATAYLWLQNDAHGAEWAQTVLDTTKCTVKRCKVPAQYKDLNEFTRDRATAEDLLAAMVSAETLREAEKSWEDTLDKSEVTSTELHDLELTPRKKLLGDWFAEGDCGFIFAFRGVGKTWFALAMAHALATGGKLGDWEAPEPIELLYVDSEMPADLMRQRCDGLGHNENLRVLNHEILFERTGKVLNIANPEIQRAITKRCVDTGVKVLFIDNLSTAAFGMNENEADSWEKVSPWLLDLRRRKIAVVIVHHAGRSGEMRGTSKREDNVFWIIALDDMKKDAEDKRGATFVSRFTKPSRNTQEEVLTFQWHFVTEPSGEVTIAHKVAQSLDVFLGLIEDGVTECSEIADEMKVSKATISRMAKKAISENKIIKKGREYFLEEGAKIADKS
jgi:putative DNA primase/helicase